MITLLAGLLLLTPATAQAGAREMIARISLVPQAPGGELPAEPVYDAADIPPAQFDVWLDDSSAGLDYEDYLAERTGVVSARFTVWLYCFTAENGENGRARSGPTLSILPDGNGRFPLNSQTIVPGQAYGWQVQAIVDDGTSTAELWSPLLYFRTAPADTHLPRLIPEPERKTAGRLLSISARQRRSWAGLTTWLQLTRLYSNYPTASDTFICAPLTETAACPVLESETHRNIPLPQLLSLGPVMAAAAANRRRLKAGELPATELNTLGGRIYSLVNQWPDAARQPYAAKVSTLAGVAEKLSREGDQLTLEDARAAISELLIAVDELVADGTAEHGQDYQAAFVAYAVATEGRLADVLGLTMQISAALGDNEGGQWADYLNAQREELAALRDEVSRGRLSKAQLRERIAANAQADPPYGGTDWRYVVPEKCLVDLETTRRLTSADTEQIARLTAEVYRCYLLRLARTIWPEGR